jgi:diguanylate cyclase (GGDEF)-like protein
MGRQGSSFAERAQATLLEAWTRREHDRAASRQLAERVRLEAGGDARLEHCANVVTAYALMREGWLAEALELVLPALAWLEESRDEGWTARALNVHNCVTAELGEFERCIVGLGRQLEISQRIGDLEMEACALHDFGAMHLERDAVRSETHLRSALDVFARGGNALGQGYALLNLTQLCINTKRVEQAKTFLEQTLELCRRHDLHAVEPYALMHQGCLRLEAGELDAAQALFLLAKSRSDARGDRPLAEVVPFMVDLYRRQGRLEAARDLLESHLEAVSSRGLLPFEVRAHELLTDVLEELGDVAGALWHSRAHVRMFKRVHTAEQEDKVRALEVLHRTQFAQRSAQEAQRSAEEARRKNAELASALDQLAVMNRAVLEASLTDELTGLRNRRYLMNLDLGAWADQVSSVAVLDLDYFKSINDHHGHDGGDIVLKEFAALLNTQLRAEDIVARFGGEEFVIFFPRTPLEVAEVVLKRLLAHSSAQVWSRIALRRPLTFTAGVVTCRDGRLLDALKRADALLYQGKNAGRNAVWLETTRVAT